MFSFLTKKDDVIRIKFDSEEMSWEDDKILFYVKTTPPNEQDPGKLQLFVAHFMTDEKGVYLPEEKAIKILDHLKRPEMREIFENLMTAINEASLPKENGRPSNSPLTASTPASPSPDGSSL